MEVNEVIPAWKLQQNWFHIIKEELINEINEFLMNNINIISGESQKVLFRPNKPQMCDTYINYFETAGYVISDKDHIHTLLCTLDTTTYCVGNKYNTFYVSI